MKLLTAFLRSLAIVAYLIVLVVLPFYAFRWYGGWGLFACLIVEVVITFTLTDYFGDDTDGF